MGRTDQRQSFPLKSRITLLEGEMDGIETEIRGLKTVLVGILISVATGAIMLAINIIVSTV